MGHQIERLDHVNVAIPAGGEEAADAFYRDLLGFEVIPKPPALQAARGGRWLNSGPVTVHLGVDPEFRAAKTAHPAFSIRDLDSLAELLGQHGVEVLWDEDLDDVHRCVVFDPFGNRIELIDV
jgi:catechol 2,3-dioxygenase-like lactoylglutathione lyase family enzyme